MTTKLKRSRRKAIYRYLSVEAAMRHILSTENAYIVAEAYLVVYDIGEPWYVDDGVALLSESLVLKLAVSGDFSVVPAFLERKAREAGCKLAVAGTALAKADAALASLYSPAGFHPEALTLTKEL